MKALMLVLLALGAMFTAATARADECGGQLVATKPIWAGGSKIGEVQLNYNYSMQRYCAVTRHAGPTWGVMLPTHVSLQTCTADDMCYGRAPLGSAWAMSDQRYVVGPVRTLGGYRRCVIVIGNIWYGGSARRAEFNHCTW